LARNHPASCSALPLPPASLPSKRMGGSQHSSPRSGTLVPPTIRASPRGSRTSSS
jgi:hypothetical protein